MKLRVVNRRLLIMLRRQSPLAVIVCWVMLAQTVAWFLIPLQILWAEFFVCVLWYFAPRWRTALGGAVVGISPLIFQLQLTPPTLTSVNDAVIPIKVTQTPGRAKIGALTFVGNPLYAGWGTSLVHCTALDLPWRNASRINRGDIVWVRGTFHPTRTSMNPFSHDARMVRQNIGMQCKARYVSEVVEGAKSNLDIIRSSIMQSVYDAAGDQQSTSVLLSMALGYRDLLSNSLERDFQITGLTHLLVVSGYQVTLVFGTLFFISCWILQQLKFVSQTRRWAALPAATLTAAFVVLCGADSSTLRALAAAACVAVQLVDEHSSSYLQRCSAAMLCLLIVYPGCFFDLGVQLTFAALLGIGIGSRLGPASSKILSGCLIAFCAWLATSFVMVAWTGKVSLLSIPLNLLLAGPWSILDCTLGLFGISLLVGGIDPCGFIVRFVSLLNGYLLDLVRIAAESECGYYELKEFRDRTLLCFVIGLTLVLLAKRAVSNSASVWQCKRIDAEVLPCTYV